MKFPGNRFLELTSPTNDQNNNLKQALFPKSRKSTSFVVMKTECMYRAHWNKRYPLGKSNKFYKESEVLQQHELLREIKIRCNRDLGDIVESVLGVYCPTSGLDQVRKIVSDNQVLRELVLIPNHSVPSENVLRVVVRVAREVFPPVLWEGKYERYWIRLLQKYIVQMSRFESLKFSKSRFLEYTLFQNFFVPLISYMFYVTEASDDTIHYFRRPLWDLVTTKSSRAFVDLLQLRRAAAADAVALRLRWIPKKNGGLRPIVSLPKLVRDKSKRLTRYLTALKFAYPDLLGSSILSRDECYGKLCKFNFASSLQFFTADIQNCFESIPLDQLSKCLETISPDNVLFDSVMVSSNRFLGPSFSRKRPIVFLRNNLENLLSQIPISSDPHNPIIVRADMSTFSNERMDYGAVRREIFRIVKSTVYRLTTEGSTTRSTPFVVSNLGLPQGNNLSVLLVSFYYGWLDRTHLRSPLSSPHHTLLIRLVDDILCISSNRDEYKMLFEKIVTQNLYGTVNIPKLRQGIAANRDEIVWAGFSFKPKANHLNVSPEKFSGQLPRISSNSLSHYFSHSLGRSLAQQCLHLFFCPNLNSNESRNENAYRAGNFLGERIRQNLKQNKLSDFPSKLSRYIERRFAQDSHLLMCFYNGLRHSISTVIK